MPSRMFDTVHFTRGSRQRQRQQGHFMFWRAAPFGVRHRTDSVEQIVYLDDEIPAVLDRPEGLDLARRGATGRYCGPMISCAPP